MAVRQLLRTVVVALAAVAVAGGVTGPAGADQGEGYSIALTPVGVSTTVTLEVHGPASSATTVRVWRPGTVVASDVPPGAYTVDATGAGMEPVHADFEVVSGAVTPVSVAVLGRVSVRGTVVDPDGAPVADAPLAFSGPSGRLYWVRTDEAGGYVLRNVGPGHLTVDFADAYLPDPVPVDVVGGQATFVRPLVARSGATLTGRLRDQAGAPLAAWVTVTPSGGAPARTAEVSSDGLVKVSGLPPGRTTLRIESGWYVPLTRDVVVAGSAVDLGTVVLRRGYSVEGVVELPGEPRAGDPVSEWRVQLFAAPAGKATGGALRTSAVPLGVGWSSASYAFDTVPAGRYVVRVVERYRSADRVAAEIPLTVASDDVWLKYTRVSMGPPISGVASGGDGRRLTRGEVVAWDVPCTGRPTLAGATGASGRVRNDGTFTIPTLRGHCYAITDFPGAELVSGLERVRGGTSGVKAHPRLWTQLSLDPGERRYGARTVVVHVDAYAPTTVEGGTVTVRAGKKVLGTAKVAHGKATVKLASPLTPGEHRLTTAYSGTTAFNASSGADVVSIQPPRPTVKISAKSRTVSFRITAKFKPSHTFAVYVDDAKRKVTLHRVGSSYTTTVKFKHVAAGRHVVRVVYEGDRRLGYRWVEKSLTVPR